MRPSAKRKVTFTLRGKLPQSGNNPSHFLHHVPPPSSPVSVTDISAVDRPPNPSI